MSSSQETERPTGRQPLTPWELPRLLIPMHRYKTGKKRKPVERRHYPAILGFVYRNRFAVANQIQRRFSEFLKSDRTTRRHLEELESLGYLAVAPARGVSPLFPKVYFVTGRGVRKLRESLAAHDKSWNATRVDRRGRHAGEGYAVEHIVHELLITEFLLAVWQTVHNQPDMELLTIQRRSLPKHPAFEVTIGSRKTRLIPDAMFLLRQADGGMVCCFLEMDNGTMNQKQISAKYTRYVAWSESAAGKQCLIDLYRRHGAKEPRPMFRLLFVARSRTGIDDERRMQELRNPMAKQPPVLQRRLWFTTVEELCRVERERSPLEAAKWCRGKELPNQDVNAINHRKAPNCMRNAGDGRDKAKPPEMGILTHELQPLHWQESRFGG